MSLSEHKNRDIKVNLKIGTLNITQNVLFFEPLCTFSRGLSFDITSKTLNQNEIWMKNQKKLNQSKLRTKFHFSPKMTLNNNSLSELSNDYHESNPNPQNGRKRYPQNPKVYGNLAFLKLF